MDKVDAWGHSQSVAFTARVRATQVTCADGPEAAMRHWGTRDDREMQRVRRVGIHESYGVPSLWGASADGIAPTSGYSE